MEELIEILNEIHPGVDFTECQEMDKILDSFDIISIISEIDDRFDVVITAEHITPENFHSPKALYELIKRIEDED